MTTGVDLRAWAQQLDNLELMLRDRGCSGLRPVGSGRDPLLLCSCRDERGATMLVYVTEEPKVGVKTVRRLREEAQRASATHLLLLCPEGLTPFAAKELKEADGESEVEVFRKAELAYCVARHSLVPPHVPLNAAERRELLARLACKPGALPKLKESDPVARHYRFPPGTVVRVDRRIGTLECEPYYRVVVP